MAIVARDLTIRTRLKRLHHDLPEWWVVVTEVACWAGLVLLTLAHDGGSHIAPAPHAGGAHAMHTVPASNVPRASLDLGESTLHWLLMWGAMMLPLALHPFRHVTYSSFRFRQVRSGMIFITAHGLVWLLYGVMAAVLWRVTGADAGEAATLVLAAIVMMAAVWQLTPAKRRALNACATTIPLAAFGRRADIACARFGAIQGWHCVRSCWALMLIMVAAGHASLIWMVVVTIITGLERPAKWRRQLRPVSAAVLVIVAFWIALGS